MKIHIGEHHPGILEYKKVIMKALKVAYDPMVLDALLFKCIYNCAMMCNIEQKNLHIMAQPCILYI